MNFFAEGLYPDARAFMANDNRDEAKLQYMHLIFMSIICLVRPIIYRVLGSTSEPLGDFRIIQQINLNRLPYGPFYQASSEELSTVLAQHKNTSICRIC